MLWQPKQSVGGTVCSSTLGSAAEDLGLTHSLIDERTHGPDSLQSWPEDRTGPLQVMIALITIYLPWGSTQGSAAEDLELTHPLIFRTR